MRDDTAAQTYALSAEAAEFYRSTFVPALFDAWARHLVDAVDVRPGQSVLDVACGTGVVAAAAADRAGPSGTVLGLDSNEAMLAVARRLRPDLRWQRGDACALPFGDGSFDVVVSQAGLMFFADRVAALREMGRVAGADGRVAVQVPGRLAGSPGYLALTEAVARHGEPDVLRLLGSYFAVGEPDLLTALFRSAGLRIDRFETWPSATRLDSVDTFVAVELLPVLDTVDPATRDRIIEDSHTALAPFTDPTGAIAAPIEVHLVTARQTPPDGTS
jgi:ubiquinone/menaquinone biosynthesis C-methylase UbiE